MLCLHKLHKYITRKSIYIIPRKEYHMTQVNTTLSGYCKHVGLFYYTNKYWLMIDKSGKLMIEIKIYDKKYEFLIYNAIYKNTKYLFTNWHTDYYRLTKTHPIYKMFDIDDLQISYGYKFLTSKLYFTISTNLKWFILHIEYDLNHDIKKGYVLNNGYCIDFKYANKHLTSFKINGNCYLKV